MNTLSFYEDASESLHGTLYGCSYHTWVYEVGIDHSDPKEILRNTERKVTLLLWQLGLFFNEVIKLLNSRIGIEELYEISSKNCDQVLKEMKEAMNTQS